MSNASCFRLVRLCDKRIIAGRLTTANRFAQRLRGLIGRREPDGQSALLLEPCRSIHTGLMRYGIDILFLDESRRVIGMAQHVPPWRVRLAPKGTRSVVEFRAGFVKAQRLALNDRLSVEPVPSVTRKLS